LQLFDGRVVHCNARTRRIIKFPASVSLVGLAIGEQREQ
jgi:hypothetical protein